MLCKSNYDKDKLILNLYNTVKKKNGGRPISVNN